MPKTSLDVITAAYQRLGVAAEDAPISAEQQVIGKGVLDGLFAEYPSEGLTTLTDVEAVPDDAFLGVVEMLTQELEGNRYGIPRDEAKWRMGLYRLRRVLLPDDREEAADLDDDGTVSDGEAAVYKRAQFY